MTTSCSPVTASSTPLQLLSRQLHAEQERHAAVNFRRACSLKHATDVQRAEHRASVRRLKHRQLLLGEELGRLQDEARLQEFADWAAERERQIAEARAHGEPRVWVAHAMDLREEPFVRLSADLLGVPTVFCVFYIAGSAAHARQLHRRWCESGGEEGACRWPSPNVPRTAEVVATLNRLSVR